MQNKISSNTNIICFSRTGHLQMKENIPILAFSGYEKLDLNFCEMMNPGSQLLRETTAKPYIDELIKLKKEYNLEYIQCHLPYTKDFRALSREGKKAHFNLIELALEYAAKLGIGISVMHPIIGSIDDNIEYFDTISTFLPDNMKIAIENMESYEEISSVEDLLLIIRKLENGKYGICLDTGHANILKLDIPNFIKMAGPDLIATHIADNNGSDDEHLLPGFGNIEWEEVIPAFKKYYQGYLNYEVMLFGKNLPSSLNEERANFSLSVASWLLSL